MRVSLMNRVLSNVSIASSDLEPHTSDLMYHVEISQLTNNDIIEIRRS